MELSTATVVDARDLPDDVEEWCVENEISTHYDNSLVVIHPGDNNPLIDWLVSQGYERKDGYNYIGIIAT